MDSRLRGNGTLVFIGGCPANRTDIVSPGTPRHKPIWVRLLAMPLMGAAPETERNRTLSEPPSGNSGLSRPATMGFSGYAT